MSLTHGSKANHTQPRKDPSKLTKPERKLAARIEDYEAIKPGSTPTEYHKPGSKKAFR